MSNPNLFSTGKADGGEAILEQGKANVRRVGRSYVQRDNSKLFPGMDIKRALVRPARIYATTDNRMSAHDAGQVTLGILNRAGLSVEDDAVMVGFIKAMCLCMALNSASVLVPGRSKFYVNGSEFDFFADVMRVLGNDARRYFRAYADITRDCLEEVIAAFEAGPKSDAEEDHDEYNEIMDMHDGIEFVAEDRGLLRAKAYIHDSAEFCTGKTSTIRILLANSKATIFSDKSGFNLVDHAPVVRTGVSKPPGAVVTSNGGASHGGGMPDGY